MDSGLEEEGEEERLRTAAGKPVKSFSRQMRDAVGIH